MFPFPVAGIVGQGNFPYTGGLCTNGTTQTLFAGNTCELDWLQNANSSTLSTAQQNSTAFPNRQIDKAMVNGVIPTVLGCQAGSAFVVIQDNNDSASGANANKGYPPGSNCHYAMLGSCPVEINPFLSQTINLGNATGGSVIFAFTNSLGTQGFGTASYSATTLTMISNLTAAIGGIAGIGTNALSVTNSSTTSYVVTLSPSVLNAGPITITGQGLTGGNAAGTMGLNTTTYLVPGLALSPVPACTYMAPTISPYQQQLITIPIVNTAFTLQVNNGGTSAVSGSITYSGTPNTMAQNITAALNGIAVGGTNSFGGGTLTGVTATAAQTASAGTTNNEFIVSFPLLFQGIGPLALNTQAGGTLPVVDVMTYGQAPQSSYVPVGWCLDTEYNLTFNSSTAVITAGGPAAPTNNQGVQQNPAPALDPYAVANNNSVNSQSYTTPQFTITAFINGIPNPRRTLGTT